MAAQLTYSYSTPKGVAGGKVDISFDEVVTRRNEEPDGVLKYGMAVQTGTTAGTTVKVPASGAAKADIEGVVLSHPNTEQDRDGGVIVRGGATVSVLKRGKVWGRLATDVTPEYGKPAYVVTSGGDAGCFTTAADGNVDIGVIFGNAAGENIAIIEIR